MAFRVDFNLDTAAIAQLREIEQGVERATAAIVEQSARVVKEYAVQNLSGVPFASETGTHTINKRTGKGAAAVQVQYPYGSPFRARIFASAKTRYGGNPEEWDYLSILEFGRGEVRAKYTPAAKAGRGGALALPGGPHELVSGRDGFRGVTGRYRFVRSLPPMAGKYWMAAAAESAKADIPQVVNEALRDLTNG